MNHVLTRIRAFAGLLRAGLVALCVVSGAAHAHGVSKGNLLLDHPYAVPSLAGLSNGAAYLRGIKNRGDQADRLLSASSPIAARVELHRSVLEGGVMRMRAVPAIDLPPQTVTPLRHSGEHHLMLIDLKQPLKDGDRFDMTLNFERAGTQAVKVWVQTPRDASRNQPSH